MIDENGKISLTVKKSVRAKNIRISVSIDKGVVVTAPAFAAAELVDDFIRSNLDWIRKKTQDFLKLKDAKLIKTSRREYLKNREEARRLILERIEHFNAFYKFKFNRLSIKNQKTLWGSCSCNGNLNFNYALLKVPRRILDYVVVHEMCHLWEFNHSKEFWRLVEKSIPNHKNIRREMKKIVFV